MQLFKNSFYVNKSQQISITDKRIYDIYSVYNKYIYTIEKIQYWKNELNFNKYLFEYI